MNPSRALVIYLRVMAAILLLALPAVFLPTDWMKAIHRWLDLGEMPVAPIVGYLTRSLSLLYAWVGLLTLFVSFDVPRYLTFIRFQAWSALVFSLGIVGIDLAAGMPTSWICGEGTCVLLGNGLLLWLAYRCPVSQN
jgi:hypothetical protein